MKNNRIKTVLGAMTALVVLAAPAQTAEQGEQPGTSREFNAKMLMCSQCHGLSGSPVRPGIPIIWGQQEPYLLKQLQDFRNKNRDVELMTWAAITIHPEEMGAVASYFAKKGWPNRSAQTTKAAAPMPPRGMAVCQACHQTNFMGAPQAEGAPAPRLAGQSYEYLVETMRAYAAGERKNNETMAQLMSGIMPADREAMARYLSGL